MLTASSGIASRFQNVGFYNGWNRYLVDVSSSGEQITFICATEKFNVIFQDVSCLCLSGWDSL